MRVSRFKFLRLRVCACVRLRLHVCARLRLRQRLLFRYLALLAILKVSIIGFFFSGSRLLRLYYCSRLPLRLFARACACGSLLVKVWARQFVSECTYKANICQLERTLVLIFCFTQYGRDAACHQISVYTLEVALYPIQYMLMCSIYDDVVINP